MIYLDYNATTPLDARVLAAMLPALQEHFGNASSTDHAAGAQARKLVEDARERVAELIGADSEEIVFTAGATESDNLAVTGLMSRAAGDADLVVTAIEHPAVLEPARRFGDRARIAPVDAWGVVDVDALRALITPRTALVAVMAANNETGAIQPIAEIGHICAEAGVALHVDAVQAAARLPLNVRDANAATMALSGHKMYGPKGVGALYVRRGRRRARLAPLAFGGGQERALRPGTLNVPGIVGLGEAARLAKRELTADRARESELRREMLNAIRAQLDCDVRETVHRDGALAQTLSIRLVGVPATAILRRVAQDVAVSSGSACATAGSEPSHVLIAQGLTTSEAAETLRISFGRQTTREEALDGIGVIAQAAGAVLAARAGNPVDHARRSARPRPDASAV